MGKILKYTAIAVVAPIALIIFLLVALFVFSSISQYWEYNCVGLRAKEILKHQFPGIETVDEKGFGSSDWMVLRVESWYCIAFSVKNPVQLELHSQGSAEGLPLMTHRLIPASTNDRWKEKLTAEWPAEKDNISACQTESDFYCDNRGVGVDKMLLHSDGSKRYYYILCNWTQASP